MSPRLTPAKPLQATAVIGVSAWLFSGLSFAGMPSVGVGHAPKAQVHAVNQLSKCLAVEQEQVKTVGPITVLEVHVRAKSSVAHCGCMSQLLSYRTHETILVDGKREEYERAFGLVAAPPSGKRSKVFSLVLKTDPEVVLTGPLSVVLSCKQPD